MIYIYLGLLKVLIPQLINKPPINLAIVKVFILLTIVRFIYTVWALHKADLSYGIIYKSTLVVYLLVIDILIQVYIII